MDGGRTLVLLKPDCIMLGFSDRVLFELSSRGFGIVAAKTMKLDRRMISEHYAQHVEEPFFREFVSYMTACPVVALIARGKGAQERVRGIFGATNPFEAEPWTVRGRWALSKAYTLVHSSEKGCVDGEIERFFGAAGFLGSGNAPYVQVGEMAKDAGRGVIDRFAFVPDAGERRCLATGRWVPDEKHVALARQALREYAEMKLKGGFPHAPGRNEVGRANEKKANKLC